MTFPTMLVQVAFGSDPFDAVPVWSDITNDVRRILIKRGRQDELDRMEAGTCTIELDNSRGDYWPLNAGGAYSPDMLPGKRINIRATYSAVLYELYTGFAEAWTPLWLSRSGGQGPLTKLRGADVIKNLSRYDLNNAGYVAELSGTRIDNVLDDISWPAGDRDVDAGQSIMQATGAIADVKAMTHLFDVQKSELGIIYQAGDGDIQFEDRHHRLQGAHLVSQATFGDDLGEQHYHNLEPEYDDEFIYNDIRMTRTGGTQQAASDAASQTAYGVRSLTRTGLLLNADADADSQANYLLKRYKDPSLRPRRMLIKPERSPDNLWPKTLGYDISTRITLRLNEASIDSDYFIEGIIHDIDFVRHTWKTTWLLSDADSQMYWILEVVGFSELESTTWLAY